jgi:hypothetical protein
MVFASYGVSALAAMVGYPPGVPIPCASRVANQIDNIMDTTFLMGYGAASDHLCVPLLLSAIPT